MLVSESRPDCSFHLEGLVLPWLALISSGKGSGVSYVPALCSQHRVLSCKDSSDCSVPSSGHPAGHTLGSARGHPHTLLVLDLGLIF